MQSWHFYVVTDKAVKARLAEEKTVAEWATTAPVIFVVCTAADKICERFGDVGEKLFAVQDTAAAVENILLCAADMGLGGCFMGAFDKEKCKQCLLCAPVCPDCSIPVVNSERQEFDYDHCKGCGICAKVCPFGAIEMKEGR